MLLLALQPVACAPAEPLIPPRIKRAMAAVAGQHRPCSVCGPHCSLPVAGRRLRAATQYAGDAATATQGMPFVSLIGPSCAGARSTHGSTAAKLQHVSLGFIHDNIYIEPTPQLISRCGHIHQGDRMICSQAGSHSAQTCPLQVVPSTAAASAIGDTKVRAHRRTQAWEHYRGTMHADVSYARETNQPHC